MRYVAGNPYAITGPTTPSVGGPCCAREWLYEIVTSGHNTVAILPRQEGEDISETRRRAKFIAAALNNSAELA